MTSLRDIQQQFMTYLQGGSSTIATQISSTDTHNADQRLDIYANAYVMRLVEVLQNDYEQLHAYMGDQQFHQLATLYIQHYPSTVFNVRYFSQKLPELLKNQSPYNDLPLLAELAMIEKAFATSFDAQDAQYLSIDSLANLPEEAWPNLTLQFHPSLQLLAFNTNAFDMWKALANEGTPPEPVNFEKTRYWIISRRSDLVSHYRPLEEDEYQALKLASSHHNFAQICEGLLAFHTEQETPIKAITFLQNWFNEELITTLGK